MTYFAEEKNGRIIDIYDDANGNIPIGSTEITDELFAEMRSNLYGIGAYKIFDGQVVINDAKIAEMQLNKNRDDVKDLIESEGVRLIGLQVPEWGDLKTIKFILSISNLLTLSNMTPEQDLARQIYLHAKSQMAWCDTASQLEINNYDPLTGWPS